LEAECDGRTVGVGVGGGVLPTLLIAKLVQRRELAGKGVPGCLVLLM